MKPVVPKPEAPKPEVPQPEVGSPVADGYDMVLRFRPREAEAEHLDLAREVAGILSEAVLFDGPLERRGPISLRVLQPVIGSRSSVWEVRLTVPDLRLLGAVLDWANRRDGNGTVLGRLTTIAGFDVLDEGVPLCRAWRVPRPAPSTSDVADRSLL